MKYFMRGSDTRKRTLSLERGSIEKIFRNFQIPQAARLRHDGCDGYVGYGKT
jgi:hypothetical protein